MFLSSRSSTEHNQIAGVFFHRGMLLCCMLSRHSRWFSLSSGIEKDGAVFPLCLQASASSLIFLGCRFRYTQSQTPSRT